MASKDFSDTILASFNNTVNRRYACNSTSDSVNDCICVLFVSVNMSTQPARLTTLGRSPATALPQTFNCRAPNTPVNNRSALLFLSMSPFPGLTVYLSVCLSCSCIVLKQQRISTYFYRAMHFSAKRGIAIACRLSVCPSVCNVGEL